MLGISWFDFDRLRSGKDFLRQNQFWSHGVRQPVDGFGPTRFGLSIKFNRIVAVSSFGLVTAERALHNKDYEDDGDQHKDDDDNFGRTHNSFG